MKLIKYTEVELISELIYEFSEYIRIEIGISFNDQKEKIYKIIKTEYLKRGFFPVDAKKPNLFWKLVFKKLTVYEYLKKFGAGNIEIDTFFKLIAETDERINLEDNFNDLSEQKQRVISLFLSCKKHSKILIDTSGMYVSVLVLTYKIIKNFINDGGKCVEVSYPHFDSNDEIGNFIKINPRVIKLGEMGIR